MNKVMIFAAHPDDELLGVGGTVRRLVNEGCEVRAVILGEGLTSRNDTREQTSAAELAQLKSNALAAASKVGYSEVNFCDYPDNRFDDVNLLDIIKRISGFLDEFEPDTVFSHHFGDLNVDHRLTFQAVITACRPVGNYKQKRIYTFETPSSTEWNFAYGDNSFNPNFFVDTTDTLEAKIDGMACYSTENAKYPHPRSAEALRAMAAYRGSTIGVGSAEAFMLIRELM